MVISDTKRIVDEIAMRAADEPYEILQHVEDHLLDEHRRAQQIASAADDRFGCKALAQDLDEAILHFRDAVNADAGFVRYKTLVGYESVVPPQWDDERFEYAETEEYRRERIAEYIESLSGETENEWYATIERCAATKSNDMATFPLFGEFLVLLAKHKPEMAERFLLRANDNVLNFLTPFLKGLYDNGDRAIYDRTVATWMRAHTSRSSVDSGVSPRWRTRRASKRSSTRPLPGKTISPSWSAWLRLSRAITRTSNR